MTEFIFASSNPGKITELNRLLEDKQASAIGMPDADIETDIPEIGNTLEQNSLLKAYFCWTRTHSACIADDTGLEVTALNNAPGVLTARYAGPQKDDEDNMDKLLTELSGKKDRSARFRTVLTWISADGNMQQFEGMCSGKISIERKGNEGFGYDPVFIPDGYSKTFAELGIEIKNTLSHRHKALKQFLNALS